MDRFRLQLKEAAGTIHLEIFSAFNVLSEGLDSVCQEAGADLIVMGISGAGGMEETLIGSNAVSVARHSTYPVIIVPAQASFVPIQEVLFACDYKKVAETKPVGSIKSLLSATGARLSVLNVYHNKAYDDTFTYAQYGWIQGRAIGNDLDRLNPRRFEPGQKQFDLAGLNRSPD